MTRRLANLTIDNLDDLPSSCRSCLAWERDPLALVTRDHTDVDSSVFDPAVLDPAVLDDSALEKEMWVSNTLLQWGSCGIVAYVDDDPAGYLTYAPAPMVPRSGQFPTSPVSPDAVLLLTGAVMDEHRHTGIARMLAQGAAKDLTRRGIRAIEAFATTRNDRALVGCTPGCLLPASFLLAVGFKTVRAHRDTPRLRLDLRSTVSWREDVEHALERILGTVRVPALGGVGAWATQSGTVPDQPA